MRELLINTLIPKTLDILKRDNAYKNNGLLLKISRIADHLQIPLLFDFSSAWTFCLGEATNWSKDNYVIWQSTSIPERVGEFIQTIERYFPAEFNRVSENGLLIKIINLIHHRIKDESKYYYSIDSNTDAAEYTEMSDGYDTLSRSISEFSEISCLSAELRDEFSDLASHFSDLSSKVSEESPKEPDPENNILRRSINEEIHIDSLFSDL